MVGTLKVRRDSGILVVTLCRPKANAIDLSTSRALGEVFKAFRDDEQARVAILTGSGDSFFCAGWDLKAAASGAALTDDMGIGGFGGLQELRDLNKPVIAAVNGMAVGGGFELALAADLIIAADHARFCLPELSVCSLPDAASIRLPRRIPFHVAMDLIFTGRWMGAAEASRWGLVNEVVAPAALEARALEIARRITDGPALAFAAVKEVVRSSDGLSFQDAMSRVSKRQLATVERLYSSKDHSEGAMAFAEKRTPIWLGA
jgi:crotonobetainyl-CoA hydratase